MAQTAEHHHRPEDLAADVADDLELERASLHDSIAHDFSTSESGIVPLDHRRPLWHFIGIWTTFAAGFSYLFIGTQIHDAGFTLLGCVGVVLLSAAIYFAYAIFAAYLGSRTGQTHALLTRSVFGLSGSNLVSIFLIVGSLGWTGFQAGLMVQIWNGLYGWSGVEALTIVFAAVMVFNNLFGFTGISVFARYVVTPLVILWVAYLVVKGLVSGSHLGAHPKNALGLTVWQIVGVIVGSAMWGNEPDIWRYGKPKFWWPTAAFGFALCGSMLLFAVGGWMMADFAGSSSFGTVVNYTTHYSLFGLLPLAFILATLSQFAINDGNYYEAINAVQNMFGGWSRWKRLYSCIVCAGISALAGYLVNYAVTNGFYKVAAFLAISVPCATVIMCVDHFLLPRLYRISRPLAKVPSWGQSAFANWPAILALAITVAFGAYATGIMPGENANRYWGPATLITWAMSGILYAAFVGIVRAAVPRAEDLKHALGFSTLALDQPYPSSQVIDLATQSESPAEEPGMTADPLAGSLVES
ncbi:MAG TPA: cytosine permease [Solirubrobacteraceae bacterium]|jgi:purine-cytosine permease-like protein|nr:cytosine permease [Solirubrobacteraceae bacterium]